MVAQDEGKNEESNTQEDSNTSNNVNEMLDFLSNWSITWTKIHSFILWKYVSPSLLQNIEWYYPKFHETIIDAYAWKTSNRKLSYLFNVILCLSKSRTDNFDSQVILILTGVDVWSKSSNATHDSVITTTNNNTTSWTFNAVSWEESDITCFKWNNRWVFSITRLKIGN